MNAASVVASLMLMFPTIEGKVVMLTSLVIYFQRRRIWGCILAGMLLLGALGLTTTRAPSDAPAETLAHTPSTQIPVLLAAHAVPDAAFKEVQEDPLAMLWSPVDENTPPADAVIQQLADSAHLQLFLDERFPSANACATCHPDHYREWSDIHRCGR